jgi:peptidoglycan-associated lipoprotein
MQKIVPIVFLLLFGLLLAGCGGNKGVKPEAAGVEDRSVKAEGMGQEYGPDGQPLGGSMSQADLLAKKRVYFAFDSSTLDDENRAIVEAHAKYLADHPATGVTLQGNTDERGTREYNLALGERRAKAVAQLMTVLGVAPSRITTISYGEEKPVALGHDESSWRLNRRVDIVYGNN